MYLVTLILSYHNITSKYYETKASFFSKYLSSTIDKREDNGTPLQYSCLANPMDGGAWWAAVHGVARSQTWLSDFIFTFHFHTLENETATHSSVLAWRIPGTGEPGGLPSLGSHRVGHDWSDLAAAAAAYIRESHPVVIFFYLPSHDILESKVRLCPCFMIFSLIKLDLIRLSLRFLLIKFL